MLAQKIISAILKCYLNSFLELCQDQSESFIYLIQSGLLIQHMIWDSVFYFIFAESLNTSEKNSDNKSRTEATHSTHDMVFL